MEDGNKKRTRLTVDISPELRQRIKIAAEQKDASIKRYVVDILEANVPLEDSVISEGSGIITAKAIERLDNTRKKIMRGRRFTVDSTDLINEARFERTEEL